MYFLIGQAFSYIVIILSLNKTSFLSRTRRILLILCITQTSLSRLVLHFLLILRCLESLSLLSAIIVATEKSATRVPRICYSMIILFLYFRLKEFKMQIPRKNLICT